MCDVLCDREKLSMALLEDGMRRRADQTVCVTDLEKLAGRTNREMRAGKQSQSTEGGNFDR
ncbi:hypothetical protein GCM10008094_35310 [Aidingimonas halophila]|nr:hypothetical protein GCM10008094_35310 [Aidingimonas halophila]